MTLAPDGGRALVPTGLAIAIPSGCAGFVLPRSGLALRHGITCLNTPGLIDPQYRGEIKVLLAEHGSGGGVHGAAAVTASRSWSCSDVETVEWVEVDELDTTSRDTFGFGSTGFGEGKATP